MLPKSMLLRIHVYAPLGTAAQLYNNQLQRSLNATGQSLLNARDSATALLTQHPDLIRFGPDKLDEAFDSYKQDFQAFGRALNKEFHLPTESYKPKLGRAVLDIGRDYAMNVIKEIEATVLTR